MKLTPNHDFFISHSKATKCDDISNYNMRSTHDCDNDDEFDDIDQRLEECRETLRDLEEKRLTGGLDRSNHVRFPDEDSPLFSFAGGERGDNGAD